MPPHTTLQYTMPSNTTTNSKPTSTASSNGTTQLASTSKPLTTTSTPTKPTSRQRRASSAASSYVFAPSWLINNKTVPAVTEGKTTKEEAKGVGLSKKDELGVVKQVKDGNSSLSSFAHASINGSAQLTSIRTKSRDFSSSRLKTLEEMDGNEEVAKAFHGRSRSASQTNSSVISSSPSSFDRNFPTLAKKKQFSLSVDPQAKSVDNMWANSDTKSKLLSPTSTQVSDDLINDSIDNEPELERRMSLVPKVESGKLDGKRAIKHSVKRKTSRSLSMDSAARSPTVNSGFGFGVGIGISSGRAAGQSQHFRPYLKESVAAKSINVQPQRPRAMSISASNGTKKSSMTMAALPRGTGQTLISKKLSIGGNSKYIWMGKMGNFKMISDDEELSNERKDNVNQIDCDHINEEEEDQESENIEIDDSAQKGKDNSDQSTVDISESCNVEELSTEQVCDIGSMDSSQSDHLEDSLPQSPVSASLEREENFLRQLGWQKPYDKDDDSQWAITEEEKRLFINLVRALNGVAINEENGIYSENTLSNGEINRANKNWAATVMIKKQQNGDICIQNEDSKTSIEYLRLLI